MIGFIFTPRVQKRSGLPLCKHGPVHQKTREVFQGEAPCWAPPEGEPHSSVWSQTPCWERGWGHCCRSLSLHTLCSQLTHLLLHLLSDDTIGTHFIAPTEHHTTAVRASRTRMVTHPIEEEKNCIEIWTSSTQPWSGRPKTCNLWNQFQCVLETFWKPLEQVVLFFLFFLLFWTFNWIAVFSAYLDYTKVLCESLF